MSGLFAQRQFGYGTYNLDPLRTSEPEVGATLPKAKAKTPTTEDPVGAKVPSKAVAGGTAAAAAAGAAEVAAASTNKSLISAPVSAGASANVINGQISKHMALDANADSRAEAATTQAGVSAPVTNTTSGASLPFLLRSGELSRHSPTLFIRQLRLLTLLRPLLLRLPLRRLAVGSSGHWRTGEAASPTR